MKKASKDVFDQFFANSIDLLCVADFKGIFLKLNSEWEKTLGYSLTELEGKPYIEFVHPEDITSTVNATEQLADDQPVRNFINRYRHKDGTYRWLEWRSFPTEGQIFATAHDITERVNSEKALKQSEERNKLIASLITDYAFTFAVNEKKELKLIYTTENFELITGRTGSEAQDTRNWVNIFHPDDYPKVLDFIGQLLSDSLPRELECRTNVKGGTRWINVVAKPETDKTTGRVVSITGAIKEITKRKEAELQLKSSEEKFLKVFMCTPDLVSIVDGKTLRYINVNEIFLEKTGFARHEVIGKTATELNRWVDLKQRDELLNHLLKKGHLRNFEAKQRTRSGDIRDCLITGETIEVNKEKSYLFFIRDITDEKRSAEALLTSEKKYRLLFENMTSGFALHQMLYDENGRPADFRYIESNPAFEKLTGYSSEAIIGKTIKEITPDIEDHWIQAYGKVARTGEPLFYLNYSERTGRYFDTYVFSPETDKHAVLFNDVTERVRAENALLESESRLRSFIDKSSEGVVIVNELGIVEEWNNAAESITGISRQSIINKLWSDITPLIYPRSLKSDTIKEQIEKEIITALKSGQINIQPHDLQLIQLPGGNTKYIEQKMFTIKTDKGYKIAGIFTDITERKETEKLIADERNTLRALIDNIPDIVYVKDTGSRFVITNNTLANILNTSVENLLGKTDLELFPGELAREFYNDEQNLIKTGTPVINKEETIFDKYGKAVIIRTTKLPIRDNSGKITGFVGSGHIITEQKQYEEALKKRVVALTKPLDDPEGIKFTDLFNVDELQRIQDTFAEATGVASLITSADGTPITKPSNFCSLCKIIRSTEKGNANCLKSDAHLGKMNTNGPTIMPCLSSGLWDAGASITLGGRHLANWFIGQIRNEAQSDSEIIKYSDEIGVDPKKFIKALNEVPQMDLVQFEKISQSLFVLSRELSDKAYQNVQQARFIAEQNKAEEKIKQQSELHQTILDTITEGLIYVKDRTIQWTNSSFCRMFGYEYAETYLADTSIIYALYDDYVRIGNEAYPILGEAKVYSTELQGKKKDGAIFWLNLSGKAVDPEKPTGGSIWMLQDITERKKNEEIIHLSEQKFRSIFENSTVGIALVGLDGKYLMVNKALCQIMGYTSEELVNLNFYQLTHPDDVDLSKSTLESIVQKEKKIFNFSKRYIHKEGRIIWTEVSSRLIYDEKNNPLYFITHVNDISDRKAAENQIHENEEKFRIAFENAPSGMSMIKPNGEYVAINPMLCKMFGYSREELISGKININTHPDDIERSYRWIQKVISGDMNEPEFEKRYIHKDGHIIWGLVRSQWIRNEDGSPRISVTHILDISERKKAEEEIKNLNRELEKKVEERTIKLNEAIKDLESFAYSVSHDLRAPIRHIDGFAKLMFSKVPNPSEPIINYYSKIEAASQRMSSMIDSLLSFSRLGRRELSISEIDFKVLVHEVIEQFKPDIGKRRIKWKISRLPKIQGDKNLIKLVVENLISNSIKYTAKQRNPFIEIGSGTETENQYEIYFKDNGTGFDMAYSGKLFGVFQRLHSSEDFEGIGIGLANVRQIIEKHQGSIRAEGKLNEGAVFYITLPKN